MFDLFRFVALRPAESIDATQAIQIQSDSELVTQLLAATNGPSPRVKLRQIADEFINKPAFVGSSTPIAHSDSLDSFQTKLQKHAANSQQVNLGKLKDIVEEAFNSHAEDLLNEANFKQDKSRLHDSLLALKLGTWRPEFESLNISRDVRLVALVEQIASSDSALEKKGAIRKALLRSIMLPAKLTNFPRANPPAPGDGENDDVDSIIQQREKLLKKYANLQAAYRSLLLVEPEDVSVNISTISPNIEGEQERLPETAQKLRSIAGTLFRNELDRMDNMEGRVEEKLSQWRKLQDFVSSEDIAAADGQPTPIRQSASLTMAKINLRPEVTNRVSNEVKSTLSELNIKLDSTSLMVAAERIKDELTAITPQVMNEMERKAKIEFNKNVVAIGTQILEKGNLPDINEMKIMGGAPAPGPLPVLPNTHGSVKPAGIGDLLVTRQQLIGYETSEVAHIENALKGEIHKRETFRSEISEETTVSEEESTKSEIRDLQSTDSFELQKESQNVLALDGRIREGSSISPSFGPVVEFENSEQSQLHGVQTLTEKSSAKFSKSITSRAVSNITERTRIQVTRRRFQQFDEKAEHSFENKEGPGNIIGVYQWLNKIYQVQVFNYGKRLFYDLVVPEPAAFLVQAFAQYEAEGRGLIKPNSFTVPQLDGTEVPLEPNHINDTNYSYYVARYQATGVKAPPEAYVTVSKIFVGPTQPTPQQLELLAPDGYEPAFYGDTYILYKDVFGYVSWKLYKTLDLELSKGGSWYAILGCRRKTSTYQQWQLNTYEAILRAYNQRLSEYEERAANIQAALRIGALGQSSEMKTSMIRNEIKKGCITLFTHQHFDVFNGIDSPKEKPVLYPQINLTNAEPQGKYIRFFEQAFEWEQMTYHFYPYFWGRKAHWITKAMLDERDPQFADFLRAGAARALVPIRPGFENAVINFMETGEIWGGGQPPEINSPTYLPLLEELKEESNVSDEGRPVDQPWKIKLPTTLVMLRSDGKLPKWQQVNGEWVES